jgi:hypothetical protein
LHVMVGEPRALIFLQRLYTARLILERNLTRVEKLAVYHRRIAPLPEGTLRVLKNWLYTTAVSPPPPPTSAP